MKKLLALALIGTLTAGLMSGCGSSSSGASSAETSVTASSETSSAVSDTSSAAADTSSAISSAASSAVSETGAASYISVDAPYAYDGDEIKLQESEASEDGWKTVSLSYKGNDTEIDSETYGAADQESFVIEENGDVYAFVCCMYDDDWRTTFLLKLNKDAETFDKIDDIDSYLSDDIANVSLENIVMSTKVDDFGSYQGTRPYIIDGDKIVPATSEYTITLYDRDNQNLKAIQSFEALKNGEEVTINEGDILYPAAVDEDNKIFKFTVGDDTDTLYEVNYEISSEDSSHTIGGVSEYDLFEMVPYTG